MRPYEEDIQTILSYRYANGDDLWMGENQKLLKGAPFTTLDCIHYLLELSLTKEDQILQEAAAQIFSMQKEDGRFKISPTGGIYPCHTALAWNAVCNIGYADDPRARKTRQYFLDTQQSDGGWKCNKYSFGRGPETEYSTPLTTLTVLDAMRFYEAKDQKDQVNRAVEFLLQHWVLKMPISPCHYGIGSLFKQVEYPFRGYNLFYYVYILSFYPYAREDARFLEAFHMLTSKLVDGKIVVERVVPKLAKLTFCAKGKPSQLATKRYQEIVDRLAP